MHKQDSHVLAMTMTDPPVVASLLSLGDGENPGPLSSVLTFLDVPSICRFERSCKALKRVVRSKWARLDESTPFKFRSTVVHDRNTGKTRAIRFQLVSDFIKRIEPLQDTHCHNWDPRHYEEWGVACQGCSVENFPRNLCTDIYVNPDSYEVFVRCSKKVGNEFHLVSEGFVAFVADTRRHDNCSLNIRFLDIAWYRIATAIADEAFVEIKNELNDVMISIAAIRKDIADARVELVTSDIHFSCFHPVNNRSMLVETHAQEEGAGDVPKPRSYSYVRYPLLRCGLEYYYGYEGRPYIWDDDDSDDDMDDVE
jgi:hypothetical protein